MAGLTAPERAARTAAHRRPARRPVGRARRLGRLGHGHRDGPGRCRRQRAPGPDRPRRRVVVAPRRPPPRRTGRPPHTTTPPRSAGEGPVAVGSRARPARGDGSRPGRGHRPPRPVRRGRHDPGAARRRRPRVHRIRRRGLRARHGQGAVQADVPRARPSGRRLARGPRSTLGRGSRGGRRTRDGRVRGRAPRPAADGQARRPRQLGRHDPRARARRAAPPPSTSPCATTRSRWSRRTLPGRATSRCRSSATTTPTSRSSARARSSAATSSTTTPPSTRRACRRPRPERRSTTATRAIIHKLSRDVYRADRCRGLRPDRLPGRRATGSSCPRSTRSRASRRSACSRRCRARAATPSPTCASGSWSSPSSGHATRPATHLQTGGPAAMTQRSPAAPRAAGPTHRRASRTPSRRIRRTRTVRRASAGLSPLRAGALLAMLLSPRPHLRRRELVRVSSSTTLELEGASVHRRGRVEARARRGPWREPVRAADRAARGRARRTCRPSRARRRRRPAGQPRRPARGARRRSSSGGSGRDATSSMPTGALFARLGEDGRQPPRAAPAGRRGPARDLGRPVRRAASSTPSTSTPPPASPRSKPADVGSEADGPERRRQRRERLRPPARPDELVGRLRLLHAQPAHARADPGPGPPAAQPAHRARAELDRVILASETDGTYTVKPTHARPQPA